MELRLSCTNPSIWHQRSQLTSVQDMVNFMPWHIKTVRNKLASHDAIHQRPLLYQFNSTHQTIESQQWKIYFDISTLKKSTMNSWRLKNNKTESHISNMLGEIWVRMLWCFVDNDSLQLIMPPAWRPNISSRSYEWCMEGPHNIIQQNSLLESYRETQIHKL